MNRKLFLETEGYLTKIAPEMKFRWLKKLKDEELEELHDLLGRLIEPEDMIKF